MYADVAITYIHINRSYPCNTNIQNVYCEDNFIFLFLLFFHTGLITETLNVCGDVNYQITCPDNTVLIITGLKKLDGTTCKDSSNCPNEESLKDTLLRDCFAKPACDMNRTTTVCSFNNGELAVKAACVNGMFKYRIVTYKAGTQFTSAINKLYAFYVYKF